MINYTGKNIQNLPIDNPINESNINRTYKFVMTPNIHLTEMGGLDVQAIDCYRYSDFLYSLSGFEKPGPVSRRHKYQSSSSGEVL